MPPTPVIWGFSSRSGVTPREEKEDMRPPCWFSTITVSWGKLRLPTAVGASTRGSIRYSCTAESSLVKTWLSRW